MQLRGSFSRPAVSHNKLIRIFAGARGVRAGWRAALFLLLVIAQAAVLIIAVTKALHQLFPHQHFPPPLIPPSYVMLNEFFLLLPILAATAIMAWLEDRQLLSYGLAGGKKLSLLLGGFAGGLAALSLLVLVLLVTGHGVASAGALSPLGALRYGAEWCVVSLLVGLTEELSFRGYLLKTLEHGTGFWPAALLTSLLFGAVHGHNQGETYIGLLHVMGAGMLLCIAIYWTKSLWLAIGFHAAWDYAENFIYGTRDSGVVCYGTLMNFVPRGNVYFSGGATGPEGSIFGLVVLLFAGGALWWILARRNEA